MYMFSFCNISFLMLRYVQPLSMRHTMSLYFVISKNKKRAKRFLERMIKDVTKKSSIYFRNERLQNR